jgi:hypothetical protein
MKRSRCRKLRSPFIATVKIAGAANSRSSCEEEASVTRQDCRNHIFKVLELSLYIGWYIDCYSSDDDLWTSAKYKIDKKVQRDPFSHLFRRRSFARSESALKGVASFVAPDNLCLSHPISRRISPCPTTNKGRRYTTPPLLLFSGHFTCGSTAARYFLLPCERRD